MKEKEMSFSFIAIEYGEKLLDRVKKLEPINQEGKELHDKDSEYIKACKRFTNYYEEKIITTYIVSDSDAKVKEYILSLKKIYEYLESKKDVYEQLLCTIKDCMFYRIQNKPNFEAML